MFDIIPNLLTLAIAILFPTFAAYKALQSPTPALLTPWLTYFVILTLLHAVENLFWSAFLSWIPFYAWGRLFVHIYLLLPGQYQGAGLIWSAHVEPFIQDHERQIEMLLQDVHERARALGLGRIEQVWELLRTKLFGDAGREDASTRASKPAPPASNSYVSSLLSRFSAPVSGPGAPSGSGSSGADVLSMLGNAAAAAASSYAGGASGSSSRAPSGQHSDGYRDVAGDYSESASSGFEKIERSEAPRGSGGDRRRSGRTSSGGGGGGGGSAGSWTSSFFGGGGAAGGAAGGAGTGSARGYSHRRDHRDSRRYDDDDDDDDRDDRDYRDHRDCRDERDLAYGR